ncbi:MAG: hypothetical protein GY936_14035, partial [Ignavibacteriae bacterium]|nr:hypothetical protein [Ignavibacteriota bacterium]
MKKSQQLFHLIKSMSKSEKRHFKVFANTEDKNKNYILLFDEIESQTFYNEKLIKKKFHYATFVNQLHVTKNYLSNQILKRLKIYHSKNSIDVKLHNHFLDIEILFKRELFEQCLDVIIRAEKIAKEYEKFNLLYELSNWKRKILLAQGRFDKLQTSFNELVIKQKSFLEKLKNENEYWFLTSKLYEVFGADKKTKQKFERNKYLKNFSLADSLQSKTLYYHIHYALSTTNNKIDDALNYVSELILLLENHPKQISDEPSSY